MVCLSCQGDKEKIELENFSRNISLPTSCVSTSYFVSVAMTVVEDKSGCAVLLWVRRPLWTASCLFVMAKILQRWQSKPLGTACLSSAVQSRVGRTTDCRVQNLVACVINLWHAESWFFCTAASKSSYPHGKFPFKVAESEVLRWPSRAPPSLPHLKCHRDEIDNNRGIFVEEPATFLCLSAPIRSCTGSEATVGLTVTDCWALGRRFLFTAVFSSAWRSVHVFAHTYPWELSSFN